MVFESFEKLYGRDQMVKLAYEVKDRIRDELGFAVNIGVSTNFLLSKMAGDFSKPDKTHSLSRMRLRVRCGCFRCPIFFCGRVTVEKPHRRGIQTIGELAQADEGMINAHLKKHGQTIPGFVKGGDLDLAMVSHEENKGYGNSLTAPVDIVAEKYAKHLPLSLSETVATGPRADDVMISVVSIHLTTYEFQFMNRQMQLESPTNITEEIYEMACRIFRKPRDGKTPIRQIGTHAAKVQENAGRPYQRKESLLRRISVAKKEMIEYKNAKQNVERLLGVTHLQEKFREKEHYKIPYGKNMFKN